MRGGIVCSVAVDLFPRPSVCGRETFVPAQLTFVRRNRSRWNLTNFARVLVRLDQDKLVATLAAAVCFGVHPRYGADPNERPSRLCGICRYFSRDVLYAPIKFQGLGLKNIYIMMGLLRVDLIASEGKANFITGDIVRTSIEATKLELGLPSSLYESDFKNLVNSQQSTGLRSLGNSWQNSKSP